MFVKAFRSRSWTFIVGMMMICVACDQGSGCSEQGDFIFPEKDKVQSAIQLRLTEPGLNFLGQQVSPLIQDALPEELNTCLPGEEGEDIGIEWRYCTNELCDNGDTGCNIAVGIGDISILAIEPSSLRLSVSLDEISLRFDVAAEPIIGCDIAIEGPSFPVNVDLLLSTPDPRRNLTFQILEANYQLSDLTVSLEDGGGALGGACEVVDSLFNLPIIRDFVFNFLDTAINGPLLIAIQGAINSFICAPCEGEGTDDIACTMQGGECFLGSCIKPDLTCVPRPLGLEGQFDIGDALSSFSPNLEAELSYFVNPGSYAQTIESGMSLGVITGTIADLNRCVPSANQPPVIEPPRAQALNSNVTPEGTAYDLGLAISQTIVDQALWAFYQSGALCLAITTDQIEQLNSGVLQILLPNLGKLTRNDTGIAITLSPQMPPMAIIGENRLGPPNENGERVLEDPLLTLDWPDLWIDFHAFMNERWTRLFSLKVHLVLPLGLSFDVGGIVPLLGDLSMAFTDVSVDNAEILLDDPDRIAMLLPTILGPLLNGVLSGLSDPIALPDLMGISIVPQEGSIRGIREDEEDFIAIFADLDGSLATMNENIDAEMSENMMNGEQKRTQQIQRSEVQTFAKVLQQQNLHPDVYMKPDIQGKPWVQIAMQAYQETSETHIEQIQQQWQVLKEKASHQDLSIQDTYEFSWRVNQQAWHPYTTAQVLTIKDPAFLIPGKHLISIRARVQNQPFTLDQSATELEVIIDAIPPNVHINSSDASSKTWVIQASDLVTNVDRLDVRYTWHRTNTLDHSSIWHTVTLNEQGMVQVKQPSYDVESLSVKVFDEAGLLTESKVEISTQQHALIGRSNPNETASMNGSGCDCDVNRTHSSAWQQLLIWLLIFLTWSIRQSKYRKTWIQSLFFIAVIFTSGLIACDDENPSANREQDTTQGEGIVCGQERCGTNQVCIAEECQVISCVEDISICSQLDCGKSEVECNEAGTCQCADMPLCPEGCGDREFCCFSSNQCQALPEACLDAEACPPGFEIAQMSMGMINENSCQLEGEICECVESVPLAEGDIGLYSDLAVMREQVWVSAYASTYGDLVIGQPQTDGQMKWQWVDGIPLDTAIVASPSGPRGGRDAVGDDVGLYSSIAVDGRGHVHIAYFDATSTQLKYAYGVPGQNNELTWNIMVLDQQAGWFADLQLDPQGFPSIVYRALGEVRDEMNADGDVESMQVSQVRWIRAQNTNPRARNEWGEALIMAERTYPADVMSWSYPEGTGLFNTHAWSIQGSFAMAWYDRTLGELWMIRDRGNGQMSPAEVIAGWSHESRQGDMGSNVELAFDQQEQIHLCYQDGSMDSLRYLSPDLGYDEIVDDGIRNNTSRPHAVHVVGEDCNMLFDASGQSIILYQDATAHALMVSRRDANGNWLRVNLRSPFNQEGGDASGFYARGVRQSNELWITHYVYQNQLDPPTSYVEFFKTPTP